MAATDFPNHYERAFQAWLIDNRLQYIVLDQHKRTLFSRSRIKTFDFLLYPPTPKSDIIIAEVKGRKFAGTSLAKLTRLQCWVTMDDIRGLMRWEEVFGKGYAGMFVFAYRLEEVDVELDGKDAYDFAEKRYVFFGIMLDDYRRFMTKRSPKWQTVTLPAENFRACAIPISELLL